MVEICGNYPAEQNLAYTFVCHRSYFFNNISKLNGKIPLLFVEGLKLNSRLAYEMSNSTLCRLEKGLKERTHRKLMFSKGAGKLCSGCAFQQKWLVGLRLE